MITFNEETTAPPPAPAGGTALACALEYIRLGWWVMPTIPGKKEPLGKFAPHGALSATNDPETARRWWVAEPKAGIGVAVAKSKLAVVDVDPRNGGELTRADLEAKHGPIVSDVLAYTGGGGEHVVFKAPPEGVKLPGKLGEGIDFKTDGYIVVEPSIHPSGKRYEWEASSNPLEGAQPSELPGWILALGRQAPAQAGQAPGEGTTTGGEWVSDAQKAELLAALAIIPSDGRDLWVRFGLALKGLEDSAFGFKAWDEWSQKSDKYDATETRKRWQGFHPRPGGVTYRSIFEEALQRGFVPPQSAHKPIIAIGPKKTLPAFPEPFRGVMRVLVQNTLQASHKPQPALAMLGALIGMAASINGEYSTASGGRFNLYGLGVAESGSGKDKPRVLAELVAALAGASILGKPGSGAGLEDALEARKNQLVTVDEVAHMLKAVNDERAATHLRDIGAVLLKLFSASANAYNRRVLANGGGKPAPTIPTIPNPCVSVLGFATQDGLGDALSDANCTDGLLGRVLLAIGDADVKPRRVHTGLTLPPSVEQTIARMAKIDPLAFVQPLSGSGSIVVAEGPGVASKLDTLLEALETERQEGDQKAARSLYARSFEKLERIAGVLAIWDNPERPRIELEHVEWAHRYVLASDAALLEFLSQHMHSGAVTRDAAHLREIIRRIVDGKIAPRRPIEVAALKSGHIARSHLLKASKMAKLDFDRALAHMQDLGELVATGEAGNPLKVLTDIEIFSDA